MIDIKIIEGFKSDSDLFFKRIYKEFRKPFLQFLKKFQLSEEEALSIFHDTLVILKRHALKGNLEKVNSSFKTYLFAIGKYLSYDYLKSQNKNIMIANDDIDWVKDTNWPYQEETSGEQLELIKSNFEKLGRSCRDVLTLFYLKGLKIKEIKELADYDNEAVVRSQKSRCLKKLKELIQQGKP